jgi:hypothetical protein
MLNTLSKTDTATITPMTDEELGIVEGGFGWLVVAAVGAYVSALNAGWSLGEKIGDHFWGPK